MGGEAPGVGRLPWVVGLLLVASADCGAVEEAPQAALPGAPPAPGDWSYRDVEHWEEVEGWDCNITGVQSPIDINSSLVVKNNLMLMPLGTFFASTRKVSARARTSYSTWVLEFPPEPPAYIVWSGKSFTLQQIEFHSPSENSVDGRFFALEGHMVHKSTDDEQLIVAQFFNVGEQNDYLEQFWAAFPTNASANPIRVHVSNPYRLAVPSLVGNYYTWMGTRTTPPCATDVTWILARDGQQVSQYQLDAFRRAISRIPHSKGRAEQAQPPGANGTWRPLWGGNSRPQRPLGRRKVSEYDYLLLGAGMGVPGLGALPPNGKPKPGCDEVKGSSACPVAGAGRAAGAGSTTWVWIAAGSVALAVFIGGLAYLCARLRREQAMRSTKAATMRRRDEEFSPLVAPSPCSSPSSSSKPGQADAPTMSPRRVAALAPAQHPLCLGGLSRPVAGLVAPPRSRMVVSASQVLPVPQVPYVAQGALPGAAPYRLALPAHPIWMAGSPAPRGLAHVASWPAGPEEPRGPAGAAGAAPPVGRGALSWTPPL